MKTFNSNQKGLGLLQMIGSLAIISIVAAGVTLGFNRITETVDIEAAWDEMLVVTSGVQTYRRYNGDYSGIANFATLTAGDYIPGDDYTTGTGQNAYGNNITAAGANSDQDLTIVYTADTAAQCINLRDRVINSLPAQVIGTPACATAALTVVFD